MIQYISFMNGGSLSICTYWAAPGWKRHAVSEAQTASKRCTVALGEYSVVYMNGRWLTWADETRYARHKGSSHRTLNEC